MNKRLNEFKVETEAVSCDYCGSHDHLPVSAKMRHGINVNTVACENCGLVFSNPRPTQDNLNTFYDSFYHLFHNREGITEQYIDKSRRAAQHRIQLITGFLGQDSPLNVLEIGAGAGQFLIKIKEETPWKGEGIEPGTDSYEYCKSIGLKVEKTFIDQFSPGKQYDLISSFHVLEHVPSPKSFFLKSNKLLKKGGFLYLEVPNLSYPGGKLDQFLQYPHLFNFNSITLLNYGLSAGFQLVFLNDNEFNLTAIFKKTNEQDTFLNGEYNFIKTNTQRYVKRLKNRDRLYGLIDAIPSLPWTERYKSALKKSI